jgi:hypothetical protein
MRPSKSTHALVLTLMAAGLACAGAKPVATVSAALGRRPGQSVNTTVQSFNAVEGADLMSKLDAARERARAETIACIGLPTH